jgi:hypothetical protein
MWCDASALNTLDCDNVPVELHRHNEKVNAALTTSGPLGNSRRPPCHLKPLRLLELLYRQIEVAATNPRATEAP